MFTGVQHLIHDIGLIFSFLFASVQTIFSFIIAPFTAIAEMARGFFSVAFETPEAEALNFADGAFDILEALPYWETLTGVIGGAIILLLIFGTFKAFKMI